MWHTVAGGLFLEALAPRRCGGCGRPADGLCAVCDELIERIGHPQPTAAPGMPIAAAYWYDPPLRRVLQAGKYAGHRRALHVIATLALERVRLGLASPDAVVAVPLGHRRRRSRGYNQSAVLAATMAAALEVSCMDGLVRTRETASQVGQRRHGRAANVANAFAWQGHPVRGARLWLVDDVITTGATTAAAAAPLRIAGAEVIAVAVARA